MSITELVSRLRDSFLSSEFDRVEEALVAREARLKAELEEKKREIGFLREGIAFERLERINAELELKRVRQEMKNCGFGLDGEFGVVKNEKCKVEGVAEVGSRKVGVLGERGVGELESEKERKVCGEGRKMGGINGSVPMKRNEGGVGASGGKSEMGAVMKIEDSDEDECNSLATLDKTKTTSCTIITDNGHQSSWGAFQKNPLTGLAESIGNLKRKLASSRELSTNSNVLDGLDDDTSSSSSSSSSSSGSFDMRSLPVTSDKKRRADATSLGLNFSQR